jgi:predicted nucleic acid-binding protein
MANGNLFYWDANVFIHYLNGDLERLPTLDAILDAVSKSKKDKIVTSIFSKVEVAWVASEKNHRSLRQDEESKIDALWNDSSIIELVDFNDEIAHMARDLLRRAMAKNWDGLKPNDAIHLATAEWVGAVEMHTYDTRLFKFSELIRIEIKLPVAAQPTLGI